MSILAALMLMAAGACVVLALGALTIAWHWVKHIEKKWAAKYDEMHEAIGNQQVQIHQLDAEVRGGTEERDFRRSGKEIVGSVDGLER